MVCGVWKDLMFSHPPHLQVDKGGAYQDVGGAMVQVHVEVTRGEVMEETFGGRGGGKGDTGGRGERWLTGKTCWRTGTARHHGNKVTTLEPIN